MTVFITHRSGKNIEKYRFNMIKNTVSDTVYKGNTRTYEEIFQILDEKYKNFLI
jgi:hypothetical protein